MSLQKQQHSISMINTEYFDYPWQSHLDRLNDELRLAPEHQFMTPARGLPPAWFNGAIGELKSNEWVLVISHNPHINHVDEVTKEWYLKQGFNAESWWNYWRTFNIASPHRNRNYVRPLARLAARALGDPAPGKGFFEFAFARMLFVEFCPYASSKWGLSSSQSQTLASQDIGFQLASKIRRLVIEFAQPRCVLVQGSAVIHDFARTEADRLAWSETERYNSLMPPKSDQPWKTFSHFQGHYGAVSGEIPVFGFNKIAQFGGRQFNVDIDHLGDRIRAFSDLKGHAYSA